MKKIFLLMIITISNIQANLNSSCILKKSINSQKHYICEINHKKIHFLDIKGEMTDVAYYHGKFLSNEIKDGVFQAILGKKDEALNSLSSSERKTFKQIFKCVTKRYKISLEDEFIKQLELLADGAGLPRKSVIEATLMIEMSSYVDALDVKMKQNKKKAYLSLISQCGLRLASSGIINIIKKVTKPLRSLKMGCTGFVAGNEFTDSNQFLHGRNFDTGLLGFFEKHPVVLRHTPKKGHPYIGISTAGLHYSGGITGLNSKGISVSTHELRTTKVRTLYNQSESPRYPRESGVRKRVKYGVIAPYMANLILKEASSIDEAIDLIKSYGHFGAWTFLVSDSKANEAVSIEVSGEIVRVGSRKTGSMAQANHFRHPDTAKYNFEYSINKSLESRARISHVEESLISYKGKINSRWGINLLSGHIDHYMGVRSFGRTVSKVITSMTHVIDSANNEIWFSLGDKFPTNYSTFLGMKVDFTSTKRFFTFFDKTQANTTFRNKLPFFESILRNYTYAYLSYRDYGNDLIGLQKTMQYLDDAKFIAENNSHFDFPTVIMRSRVGLKLYSINRSKDLLQNLQMDLEKLSTNHLSKLHTYEKSQVFRDLAIIEDLNGNRQLAAKLFNKALENVNTLTNDFPSHHFLWVYIAELKVFMKRGFTIYDLKNLKLHFGTAE